MDYSLSDNATSLFVLDGTRILTETHRVSLSWEQESSDSITVPASPAGNRIRVSAVGSDVLSGEYCFRFSRSRLRFIIKEKGIFDQGMSTFPRSGLHTHKAGTNSLSRVNP